MTTVLAAADWGSVPDWVGGVGSALAFFGFAVAFWWEIHQRRLADRAAAEERHDTEVAQARLVYTKLIGGSDRQTRFEVHNGSGGPVIDIKTDILRGPVDNRRVAAENGRRLRTVDLLGPLDHGEEWISLDVVNEDAFTDGEDVCVRLTFTDSNGLRWVRLDNGPPQRVLDGRPLPLSAGQPPLR